VATYKLLLVSVIGKKYQKGDEVSLDNVRFVNCAFDECSFLYSGGPFLMENCQLHNCNCEIQGAAGIVLESLGRMGWQISPPTGLSSSVVH
jgi:hypothetical protein